MVCQNQVLNSVQLCNYAKVTLIYKHQEELEKKDTEMAKSEALYRAVVLSMKKNIYAVILKMGVDNQAFLDSKEKSINYVIKRDKNNSADLQNNFDENSSLTLEKHRLSLADVRETRVASVAFSKKNY